MLTYRSISKLVVTTIITQYASICFGQGKTVPSTEPSAGSPDVLAIPNEDFNHPEHSGPGVKSGMDPNVTSSGKPALLLLSTAGNPVADGNAFCRVDVTPFLGKRIRISTMLKSANLANWGGIAMAAIARDGKWVSFDTLSNQLLDGAVNRPISGTTDWSRVEIVSDIPADTSQLMIGLRMKGSGRLWIDGTTIEVVGSDTPTTDDQNPHLYSDYAEILAIDGPIDHSRRPSGSLHNTGHSAAARIVGTDWLIGSRTVSRPSYSSLGLDEMRWKLPWRILSLVAVMPGRQSDREIDNQAGQPAFPLTANWRRYEVTGNLPASPVSHGRRFSVGKWKGLDRRYES